MAISIEGLRTLYELAQQGTTSQGQADIVAGNLLALVRAKIAEHQQKCGTAHIGEVYKFTTPYGRLECTAIRLTDNTGAIVWNVVLEEPMRREP